MSNPILVWQIILTYLRYSIHVHMFCCQILLLAVPASVQVVAYDMGVLAKKDFGG